MPGVKRFELVIVAAILVSLPSFMQAFNGGISLPTALVRFTIALVVCAALGAMIERTLDTYARDARQREIERRVAESIASREAFYHDRGES